MRGWSACVVLVALGCSGAAGAPPSNTPGGVKPSAPTATTLARAPAELQKTFTGQAQPSLVVENGFPTPQHVFVDWVHQAVLAPKSSQSFALSVGTHTVTCADSQDPDDHPAAVTETFETGFAYRYQIRPSSDRPPAPTR